MSNLGGRSPPHHEPTSARRVPGGPAADGPARYTVASQMLFAWHFRLPWRRLGNGALFGLPYERHPVIVFGLTRPRPPCPRCPPISRPRGRAAGSPWAGPDLKGRDNAAVLAHAPATRADPSRRLPPTVLEHAGRPALVYVGTAQVLREETRPRLRMPRATVSGAGREARSRVTPPCAEPVRPLPTGAIARRSGAAVAVRAGRIWRRCCPGGIPRPCG